MKKHSQRFLDIVQDAKSRIQETDVQTVFSRQQSQQNFHLVDVREKEEWLRGHLPGAIHLGKGVLERDVEAQLSDLNEEIILYCGGGYRSALAAENLQRMGYTKVSSMDGGFRGWSTADNPIVIPTATNSL